MPVFNGLVAEEHQVIQMARLIFYGTGNLAATVLSTLHKAGHDIALVVCEPDFKVPPDAAMLLRQVKGESGMDFIRPSAAASAERLGLKIIQPASLKDRELPELMDAKADVAVACEYGLFVPKRIRELPSHGTLNLHTALLPKYRGPTAVQSALINGEEEAGVTIILMNDGIDCGPIVAAAPLKVGPEATALSLEAELSNLGAALLLETLPRWLAGEIRPVPQDESKATWCHPISRKDGRIDWRKKRGGIYNRFRGLCGWTGVWSMVGGSTIEFFSLRPAASSPGFQPGKMVFRGGRIFIGCGDGSMEVLRLKKGRDGVLEAAEFIKSHPEMDGQTVE